MFVKQIAKTPEILAKLRKAVGNDASVENLAVFEAIALNTRPLRKRHPIYNKAVAGRDVLLEMAARLDRESVPLQLMHEGDDLPVGRAFYGDVIEKGSESELRTLFFIDGTNHVDLIAKLDSGTVDQVSVGMVSRQILCSDCSFDYLGADAAFENIFEGTCADGHKIGEGNTHARLVGLDTWFELSLVGQGGAQNARIVSQDQSVFANQNIHRLAASGADLGDHLILTATIEQDVKKMDLQALVDQLTSTKVDLSTATTNVTTLTAQLAERDATITTLQAQVESVAAKDAEITTLTAKVADLTAADQALRDVAKKVLVATGNQTPDLPEAVTDLVALISEKSTALITALAAGGKSKSAVTDVKAPGTNNFSAFRVG